MPNSDLKPMRNFLFTSVVLFLASALAFQTAGAADKKIVLIAGETSHGPGDHEFRAGCLLLKKCLDQTPGVKAEMFDNGWPKDNAAFEGADAVLIYADGGERHPGFQGDHAQIIASLIKKGVGLGCAHYGVEVPKGEPGRAMQEWIGGYYEHLYSVNPMWKPEFSSFPDHPVTRGVKPFALVDEWYFNMRFVEPSKNLTPILVAKPSDQVRKSPYVYPAGPYEHIIAASGRPETMMWVLEGADGGRGFGFTGGHKHVNWSNDNFRKVVLNALLWIAKAEVPSNGVQSTVTPEEITQNLDSKPNPPPFNITGKWAVAVETSAGSGKPSFNFIHAGGNLLGTYKGRFGEAELSGSVKTNEVKWSFPVEINGQQMTNLYKGEIQNANSMKGTVNLGEYEGTWTAQKQ